MRILHTADWHLGQELHGYDRTGEHDAFLTWLYDAVSRLEPDALIVAGDVFDSANPSAQSTKQFYQALARIRRIAPTIDVVIIGGNHDSPRRLELPTSILGERLDAELDQDGGVGRLTIAGALTRRGGQIDFDPIIAPLTQKDGSIGAICVAVPFPRPGDLSARRGRRSETSVSESGTGPVFADAETDAAERLSALYTEGFDAARERHPTAPIVMMGHLAATGAAYSKNSERRIVFGGEETVSTAVFPEGAAYVALGHLHRAQTVPGPTLIRYAGSPFPLSATERDYRHSVSLVTLGNGPPELEEIATPRPAAFMRTPETGAADLVAVEDQLTRLDPPAASRGMEAFLEVAVRLTEPTPDLRARIEAAIGDAPVRLVRIAVERPETTSAADMLAPLATMNPAEIFAGLHVDRYGVAPSPPLSNAFNALLSAVEHEQEEDDAPSETGVDDATSAGVVEVDRA